MSFSHPSKRPGSGRPSSRFNPITGEEVSWDGKNDRCAGRSTSSGGPLYRPDDVPALNLGSMLDDDDTTRPSVQQKTVSKSPSVAATPTSGGSYRYGTLQQAKAEVVTQQCKQQHSPLTVSKDYPLPSVTSIPNVKKLNAEEVDEEKRREKVIETVLLDQLSRAVISQPEEDHRQETGAGDLYHQPGMPRGHIRKLHESKILARGAPTEMLLSQRVRFGARVLTRVSQDALRELTGFFFANDNSMTIYEYKQFGKAAKAMPFISKGTYFHPCGRKRGSPVTLADIVMGRTIIFSTAQQGALPVSLKEDALVLVRVTEVDEEAKQRIVLNGVRNSEKESAWSAFHQLTKEELHDNAIIQRVQAKVRSFLKKRSLKAITGFAAQFRSWERPGCSISKAEFAGALEDFRISLSAEDFADLWYAMDVDGNGVLTVQEAVRGFLGEMSEDRNTLVRKAFQKLDTGKRGAVPLSQLIKFFSASKHPHVCSGATSAIVLTESFLSHWTESPAVQGSVTYTEFEDYYQGISATVDSDHEFEEILRGTWGL